MSTLTMSPFKEYLKDHFCDSDGFRDYLRKIVTTGEYIVASDGHVLAEISLSVFPQLDGVGEEEPLFPKYENLMPKPIENPPLVRVQDLRVPDEKIIDKEPDEEPCKKCDGRGGFDHECDCEYCFEDFETCKTCRGDGVIIQGERIKSYMKINDQTFRTTYINHLCGLLNLLGVNEVELHQGQAGAVLLQAKGVRLLAMPITGDFLNHQHVVHELEVVSTTGA